MADPRANGWSRPEFGVEAFSEMLSPKAMFSAWRTAATLPALSLIEGFTFAARRRQAQAEFIKALTSCHDAPEMFEKQSSFLNEAVADYRREAERLSKSAAGISALSGKAA